MNAIIYCRVSTKKQVEEGTSLDMQETVCKEYAKREHYEVTKKFIEEGESAKSSDRTKFLEMIEYCRQNYKSIDSVIFYKIDRFMRDSTEYGLFRALLKKMGIRLLSATEKIEDNPSGRFMETMLAAAAQWDNEVRAERSRAGMVEAVKEGRWQWKAPIGFYNTAYNGKANIAPYEPQAKLLPKVFELLVTGYKPEAVRLAATKMGLTEKDGKPISSQRFHKLIRNKALIGIIESPQFDLVVKASHPFIPIVDEKLFWAAQEALDGTKKSMPKYQMSNPDFPLRGMRCECGGIYTGSWVKGRSKRYAKYRCRKCHGQNPNRDETHNTFIATLNQIEYPSGFKELLIVALETNWELRNQNNHQRAAEIIREISSLKEQQKNIAAKNAAGVTPDDLAKELIAEINNRVVSLEKEQAGISQIDENITEIVKFGLNYLDGLGERWEAADLPLKERFQTFFFPSGLTLYKNGKFGTDSSLLLVRAKSLILDEKSTLAAPRGVEPLLPH